MSIFRQSRAKLDWANKHIAALERRIELLRHSDVATVEINPDGGNEVIKHDITDGEGIREIALLAGDVVHNLKCVLDYAWLETISVLAPSAKSKFAKFPVYPTQAELKAALCGNKIDEAAPALLDVMLRDVKPYTEGDFAIWPIHRLDIRDKHRLLIPVIFYSSISGIEIQDERGDIHTNGFTMGTEQRPPWYIPMPKGAHVTNTGKVSLNLMFEYGPGGYDSRTMDPFPVYSTFILQVVEKLEALVICN